MHRKEQLNELLKQWLALEIDETCVRADSFTRYRIEKHFQPKEIHIKNRSRGHSKTIFIIGYNDGGLTYTTGYEEKDEHSVVGVAMWALEQSVEND